jgi:hypothetical protein
MQVYYHLRKWRARWIHISKLRDLSGAGWDEDTHIIILEDDTTLTIIQLHKLTCLLTFPD